MDLQKTEFPIWGRDNIEPSAIQQMEDAMTLPPVRLGALMPDAHQGYFLPIGGVIGLDNAVCPYAVGVDIACRMKLSIFDIEEHILTTHQKTFSDILEMITWFGVGVENPRHDDHEVLSKDWGITEITKKNFERGKAQLGTSGSGNHFVEFGVVEWNGRRLVALLSHSGSRGVGAAVCAEYTNRAKAIHPEAGEGAWLDLDSSDGQEYWAAMNLMGEYAAANHDVIHNRIGQSLNSNLVKVIENHHNFAWKEVHQGQELIVHRKGATPAGKGVLGIIPGSMGTPAYIVSGKGNDASLHSASHGAGRKMSRKLAKKTFDYKTEIDKLRERGIIVLSAGADEVCGVYKNIDEVMACQTDLVNVIGKFEPKIVKMCGTKDRAED